MVFFNDNNPFVCRWVKRLYPRSRVSLLSIADLIPEDVRGHKRVHLFAGIGGWEYALELAGWPQDAKVWTGSCPCQPFSMAGNRRGKYDERHLWPEFFRLVKEVKPPTIFGEQVAGNGGLEWFDGVSSDLEACGYETGCVSLTAAGVGAPHKRDRLYWVAHSHGEGLQGRRLLPSKEPPAGEPWEDGVVAIRCADGGTRRVKSGIRALAYGVPRRMEQLYAYGNAVVPQVAALFVRAFLERELSYARSERTAEAPEGVRLPRG
jgi:DNA (cytosine-5)-methyltransferase 1